MTIEQVKEDIKSGKSKTIYYSANTLWWTHLDEDLNQATEQGRKMQQLKFERIINNPTIPEVEKERIKALLGTIKKSTIPLDPSGSVLFMMDDCMKWITEAEKKPEHFGISGLKAFMKAHHQNSGGNCFSKWEHYN